MKTLTAVRNGGRCPKCGDQTAEDRKGRGFVRHLANRDCDFQRGEKDVQFPANEIRLGLEDTFHNRMSAAIRAWMAFVLEKYPGWREMKRQEIGYVFEMRTEESDVEVDFVLPEDIEGQRLLVLGYVRLLVTVELLGECQYYLRRFPFRGLPVTRSRHVTNVCEMYFSRCYQFKELFKNYLGCLKAQVPNVDIGRTLKQFDKAFGRELKTRNQIHHHGGFSDISIDRLFLQETAWRGDSPGRDYEYRRAARFWIEEIRLTVGRFEEVLENVAKATLENCPFLSKFELAPISTGPPGIALEA